MMLGVTYNAPPASVRATTLRIATAPLCGAVQVLATAAPLPGVWLARSTRDPSAPVQASAVAS